MSNELLFGIIKLAVGIFGGICAVVLWSKVRNPVSSLLIITALINFTSVVIELLAMLNIVLITDLLPSFLFDVVPIFTLSIVMLLSSKYYFS